ncbi:MAG: hypothetical protein JSS61_05105 [Verrucomicrobia bacterium]|nr:hypothetical protein [Verrucomicrobiota bacterium]
MEKKEMIELLEVVQTRLPSNIENCSAADLSTFSQALFHLNQAIDLVAHAALQKKEGDPVSRHLKKVISHFKKGEAREALEHFRSHIPDSELAGPVFGALYTIAGKPGISDDFGREAFYGTNRKCWVADYKKQWAIELGLLHYAASRLEQGEASARDALPLRLRRESAVELRALATQLATSYKDQTEVQYVRYLQEDLKSASQKRQQNKAFQSRLDHLRTKVNTLFDEVLKRTAAQFTVDESDFYLVEEQPMDNFRMYVHESCPGIDAQQAIEWAQRGRELLNQLHEGREISETDYLEQVRCIVWRLMEHAVNKNQGFIEGTFTFSDPDQRIMNHFLRADEAYERWSSHFKERRRNISFRGETKTQSTFGIDIEKLPASKQTVLFGSIAGVDGSTWAFVKPENYGTQGIYNHTMHVVDYLATRPAHFLGQAHGTRKEHTPIELKRRFDALVAGHHVPSYVKKFGVAGMLVFLGTLDSSRANPEMRAFMEELESMEYAQHRSGNEVICGQSMMLRPQLHQGNVSSGSTSWVCGC